MKYNTIQYNTIQYSFSRLGMLKELMKIMHEGWHISTRRRDGGGEEDCSCDGYIASRGTSGELSWRMKPGTRAPGIENSGGGLHRMGGGKV